MGALNNSGVVKNGSFQYFGLYSFGTLRAKVQKARYCDRILSVQNYMASHIVGMAETDDRG